jgi:hypothetical protein
MRSAVVALPVASIKSDLPQYLQNKPVLIPATFGAVLEDVAFFTAAIVQDGLAKAFARLPGFTPDFLQRPFIAVADIIAEHHVRFIQGAEREIIRKSVLEAYIHAGGPRAVFGPTGKTRLVRSLRRYGERNFAGLIFSLHLFNVISLAIQDKVRENMTDARSFELYMLGVEEICRESVDCAIKTSGAARVDRDWAAAVMRHIERQLMESSVGGAREEGTQDAQRREAATQNIPADCSDDSPPKLGGDSLAQPGEYESNQG